MARFNTKKWCEDHPGLSAESIKKAIVEEGYEERHYKAVIDFLGSSVSNSNQIPISVNITEQPKAQERVAAPEMILASAIDTMTLIPTKDQTFTPFGDYSLVKKVINSRQFYPIFITGLSGNGKTFFVEQACAELKREYIRCNITQETDEDDLFGGFRLVNGETKWFNGPVVEALERGAILLLDELDLASHKIMALQPVLEGKGVFLKKINTYIRPHAGFNIFATANTKGRGSDTGHFVGTNILNEAFLERFPITIEQPYPDIEVESTILKKLYSSLGETLDEKSEFFIKKLTEWSALIRATYDQGGINNVISTRRLVHIIKAYTIFKLKARSIQYCINRFDKETQEAFLEVYMKLDADAASEGL